MRTPLDIYGELFERVQSQHVFDDSKTFVDAIPRKAPEEILKEFAVQRNLPGFDLKSFIQSQFRMPDFVHSEAPSRTAASVRTGIEALWPKLTRAPDRKEQHSSLIELPKPYVVPGGRFRELYYWDSYFTMLGLAVAGNVQMLQDMVDNFAFLVDRIGFIPNGTRSYFCTRSQPPFFVLMIELLATLKADDSVYRRYFPQLRKEYEFWMAGADELAAGQTATGRVARIAKTLLNRYWDNSDQPREESYAEDIAIAAHSDRERSELYRDIRAACESGWDFSSRWFRDATRIESIRTTRILPVDLNSILHKVERVLGKMSKLSGDSAAADFYLSRAAQRKAAIQSVFYDPKEGFFVDILLADHTPSGALSLAAAYPLFFGLATGDQAASVAARLRKDFLRPGGWLTTPLQTGQQWDAPNGWAPLQWIVFEGLRRYGFDEDARTGAARWIANNTGTFEKSGRFMEKYNVVETGLEATGGEYSVQDGFGWTNGVLLSLLEQVTDR
jgi:alpha,alpha-trehalase